MYIQSSGGEEAPLRLPNDYSGNAFPQPPRDDLTEPPPGPHDPPSAPRDPPPGPPEPCDPCESPPGPIPGKHPPQRGGIFGRFPFLAPLLPPPRKKGECGERQGRDLFDLVIIGAALLLFLDEKNDDILPLLLLLLLWD